MPLFGGPPNIDKMKSKRDIPGLIKTLGYRSDRRFDADAQRVRQAAANALKQLAPEAVEPLLAALADADIPIRVAVVDILADLRELQPLINAYGGGQHAQVRQAIDNAVKKAGPQDVDVFIAAVQHQDGDIRRFAVKTLGQLKDARATDALTVALQDSTRAVPQLAAEALGEMGDKRAAPALIAALNASDAAIRLAAAEALGKLGSLRAVEPLIAALNDGDIRLRQAAVLILGQLKDPRAVHPLITALKEKSTRPEAVEALSRMGRTALEPLLVALKDFDQETRQSAMQIFPAMGWITGEKQRAAQQLIQQADWGAAIEMGAPAVTPQAGFAKVVITGGEPAAHPQRDALLDALRDLRQTVKPLHTVLRTNLAYPLNTGLIERLAHSTDQVVVSVDGDEISHDTRRGVGTYARTVANLRALLAADPSAQVSLTAVLAAAQIGGADGAAVRALGDDLGIDVRFKAVLPLGRGTVLSLTPTYYSSLDDSPDALVSGSSPLATCGLGMNLYVGPRGECYPCYALMGARHALGNVLDDGLTAVLERNTMYRRVTVDSNRQCRECALRYLCGGFCRAWGQSDDPDAPPGDCASLHERARNILRGALEMLDIEIERWTAADLLLPEMPPIQKL